MITLVLVCVTDLAIYHRRRGACLIRSLPLICGVLATLACIPFYLGQREGLSVPTWIPPITIRNIAGVFRHILFVPPMLVMVAYVVFRAAHHSSVDVPARQSLARLLPLMSLLLFPIIVVVFSLIVQPALRDRYVIVAVAPLGALVAAIAAPANGRGARWIAGAVMLGLMVIGGYEIRQHKRTTDIEDSRIANAVTATQDALDRQGAPPVVFYQRREQYPVIQLYPELANSVVGIDFDGKPSAAISDRTLYERDMARRVNRFYPRYRLMTLAQLSQLREFTLVSPMEEEPEMFSLLRDFQVTPVRAEVYRVRCR
jgi:hypothetical protein